MRGVSKKMFISILTSVIVFVTMVATTFAWVGIFTYANTDTFNLNLKVSDLDVNYYLTISATGNKGTFSDSVDINDVHKNVLKGITEIDETTLDNLTETEISALYSKYSSLFPATCQINDDNTLSDFTLINSNVKSFIDFSKTKSGYLKFDLYLSADAKEGIQDTTSINLNVYLTQLSNTLVGTVSKQKLTNGNPLLDMPSIPNNYSILKMLPENDYFNVDSANASRFALCIYNPIEIDDEYNSNDKPVKTLIYQGGTQLPSVNNDVFSLGGNLPEDYNTALQELLIIRPDYKDSLYEDKKNYYQECLQKAILRGESDLELVEKNSKIWDKPALSNYIIDTNGNKKYNYLGVKDGIQTKQKVTVFFWFEGWDADCLVGIDKKGVTLNLTFTAGVEE